MLENAKNSGCQHNKRGNLNSIAQDNHDDGQTTDGDHDQDVNVLNRCSMDEASSGTVSVVDFQQLIKKNDHDDKWFYMQLNV